MPNPWLNEHKSMAAMNYFLNKHCYDKIPDILYSAYALLKENLWPSFLSNCIIYNRL
jgi:hypothetical protein